MCANIDAVADRQGAIRTVLDNAAAVKDAIAYDAFGNIASESDPNYGGRYQWTGREFDTETQLQFNRARYYDATYPPWPRQHSLPIKSFARNNVSHRRVSLTSSA